MASKIEISPELAAVLADDHAPYQHLMAAKARLREIIAEPEAPRQEPVAWEIASDDEPWRNMVVRRADVADEYARKWRSEGARAEFFELYRHPAPLSPDHSGGAGKVVLPERMDEHHCGDEEGKRFAEGYNQCIDDTKELNQ